MRLEAEHIHMPIVACGITNDVGAAVAAIHARAKEYIPLPPEPELIAAILVSVGDEARDRFKRYDEIINVGYLATACEEPFRASL